MGSTTGYALLEGSEVYAGSFLLDNLDCIQQQRQVTVTSATPSDKECTWAVRIAGEMRDVFMVAMLMSRAAEFVVDDIVTGEMRIPAAAWQDAAVLTHLHTGVQLVFWLLRALEVPERLLERTEVARPEALQHVTVATDDGHCRRFTTSCWFSRPQEVPGVSEELVQQFVPWVDFSCRVASRVDALHVATRQPTAVLDALLPQGHPRLAAKRSCQGSVDREDICIAFTAMNWSSRKFYADNLDLARRTYAIRGKLVKLLVSGVELEEVQLRGALGRVRAAGAALQEACKEAQHLLAQHRAGTLVSGKRHILSASDGSQWVYVRPGSAADNWGQEADAAAQTLYRSVSEEDFDVFHLHNGRCVHSLNELRDMNSEEFTASVLQADAQSTLVSSLMGECRRATAAKANSALKKDMHNLGGPANKPAAALSWEGLVDDED